MAGVIPRRSLDVNPAGWPEVDDRLHPYGVWIAEVMLQRTSWSWRFPTGRADGGVSHCGGPSRDVFG